MLNEDERPSAWQRIIPGVIGGAALVWASTIESDTLFGWIGPVFWWLVGILFALGTFLPYGTSRRIILALGSGLLAAVLAAFTVGGMLLFPSLAFGDAAPFVLLVSAGLAAVAALWWASVWAYRVAR